MKLLSLKRRVPTISTDIAGPASTKRIEGREAQRIRRRIALRDGFACRSCGMVVIRFEIDHVVPLHLGGAESDENRQLLCVPCHKAKTASEEAARGGGHQISKSG
ncbi:MAG TPA: HNH endonuclease [Verrucomicrobia bacterium]|nr:HNH endonuclease [Verrucomicrobiota bacterium]